MKILNRSGLRITTYGLLLLFPLIASAAIIPNCNPLPGNDNSCGVDDIFKLLINIYNFLLGMLAFVAVLFIVWAGVQMMIHHLGESPLGGQRSSLENAKYTLTRAIWGIVIVAAAWLLVNTTLVVLGLDKTSRLGCLLGRWGLINLTWTELGQCLLNIF